MAVPLCQAFDCSRRYDGIGATNTPHQRSLGGDYFNQTSGLMEMYDVGQSSLTAQEAYSLAELARLLGKPQQLQNKLKARGDLLKSLISSHLWDESSVAFTNAFSTNGSFNPRISPTSFYPLQARAATNSQAKRMVARWLTNRSAFCVTEDGDYGGNDPNGCYWGLPSINAADPAFPHGYWRGAIWYHSIQCLPVVLFATHDFPVSCILHFTFLPSLAVRGPMVQLTYWSLQNYDQVPSVRSARKALAKQMAGLMMSQWDAHRHICGEHSTSCVRALSCLDVVPNALH